MVVAPPQQAAPPAPRRVKQDNLGAGDEPPEDILPTSAPARRVPVAPFDPGAWAGTDDGHTRVDEPEAARSPEIRRAEVIEHEVIDLDAQPEKGHHGAHGDHPLAAPVDTKGILKVVFWGMAGMIVLCMGSIGFLYWLFV